ncbi:MAG TPA: biopolymer transporter ExbD [Fibrobacteraceae bacterium]|nr:biopolymer transporter ExbD [Fibrobacteraceae bacterium]
MDEHAFDQINVVPFIDIMLVLLTIVLSTSTLIASGHLPLELPQATSAKNDLPEPQVIEINPQGVVYHAGEPITLPNLQAVLSGISRSTPVLIRADKELKLQAFIDVLDIVKELKFSQVSLQTQSN